MAKRKPHAATNENLLAHALEPTMRRLIAAALDGSPMTYGEVKAKLENQAGFSTIFAIRIGLVAGSLTEKIQSVEPDAPLINVLVVNQKDRQPSEGAGSFMARRFGDSRLKDEGAKKRYPKHWEAAFNRAAGEVYKYSEAEWSRLFERVFGKPLAEKTIEHDRVLRKQGSEEDGIPTGRKYGKGGEGEFHKALRLWIEANPGSVHKTFRDATAETEADLDSGDRVDVVYKLEDRTIVIEVKSRISDDVDLRRGVFQCVKYRAVRKAMDVRDDAVVEAYLVTEEPLPGEIAALLKRHEIKHYLADKDRAP